MSALQSLGCRGSVRSPVGDEARSGSTRHPPQAIVLVSHAAVVERIRELCESGSTIGVFVVGPAPESFFARKSEWEAQVLAEGADGYAESPSVEHGFLSRLQATLRRASGQYRIASATHVELREQSRLLLVCEHAVVLSARELELVRYLYQHSEQWISREQLFRDVLRVTGGYDSSLIRTHVLNIRKKLGRYDWILRTDRERGVMLLRGPAQQRSQYS